MTRQKHTEVIGIASGKGGAGKTTVSFSLALALKEMGFRVMLFDADLGLTNAPILLGTRCPFNISHVLSGEKTLAGITPSVMTLMTACHRRFIVMRNDPSSIADAYGTIKVLMEDELMDEIYLIPNAVNNQLAGEELFQRINRVCAKFLEHTVQYTGTIEHDDLTQDAHMHLQPLMMFAPTSQAAKNFRKLAQAVSALPSVETLSGGVQFFVNRWLPPHL